jgi:hypothetical protein
MSFALRRNLARRLLLLIFAPAFAICATALAQPQPAPTSLVLAINEGGSGNADAADILFRYQEFGEVVEKALRVKVSIVNARGRDRLKENLKNGPTTFPPKRCATSATSPWCRRRSPIRRCSS